MNSFQFFISITAACGGLLQGYESGVMNVVLVMDAFRTYFKFFKWDGSSTLDEKGEPTKDTGKEAFYRELKETPDKSFYEGLITSAFVLGALIGSFAGSVLGDKLGRRNTLLLGAIVFAIGGLLQGFSIQSYLFIAFGRLVTGLAVGCNSVICPTYISEVAPANIRGTLASCFQLMITIGIVIAAALNSIVWYCTNVQPDFKKEISQFEWRFALALQFAWGLALAGLLLLLPKSPRWLCTRDQDEEAAKILAKLYSTTTDDAQVQEELKAIQEDVASSRAIGNSSVSELFSAVIRRRTLIVFFLQLFQQWTGINVIMYYQSQIYESLKFTKLISTVILPIITNIINCLSTFPGMWGIEKFGRKPLLVFGGVLMAAAHFLCWACSTQTEKSDTWKILAVVCVFIFIFGFACSWGPVPWVYQGEVFPLRVRVKGSSVGSISNYLNNWIVAFLGPFLMKHWETKTFILFGFCCVVALLFAQFFVLESKGLNLEDMDSKIDATKA